MVIDKLKNAIVFLDTSPLIYFIEGKSDYQERLEKLFNLNDENYFKFLTSAITLLEVLVKPLKEGETKIVEQSKTILTNADGIDIFDITTPIAVKAAEIRAKYNIRTPDALQIATAIVHKADYFLTNDLH
ncbi:MAG: type II toxin-antitoxin system VapC family toxin [Ferruginibacter sp.]